jgi:neutral ceramidase
MLGKNLRRHVPSLFLLVVVGCAYGSAVAGDDGRLAGTIQVGVAKVDITPSEPIRLTGYPDRRTPTDSVVQRLSARALAFGSDAEGPAVLIIAELVGVPYAISEELGRRLQSHGVDRSRLVVGVTHTHNGPALSGVLPHIFAEPVTPDQQSVIDRYTESLVDLLEVVAIQALLDRRPAHVAWGQGMAGIAANRRVLRDGVWVGFGYDPDGAVDHDLPVLRVTEPDGGLRAVLLGYATHGTTLIGADNFIHGDWAGTALEMLEARHPGATALVVIGAGADTDPRPRGNGLPDVDHNARAIADEVDRVLDGELRPVTVPPTGRFRALDLSFDRLPTRAELEGRAGADDVHGRYARDVLGRLDLGGALSPTVPLPVQTWTFGEQLAMVFLGGEVVVDFSRRLKRELDSSRVWINAYANDVSYYVASDRLMAEGGYEVDGSMVYYGHPSRFARSTEELIVRTVRELLPDGYLAGSGDASEAGE